MNCSTLFFYACMFCNHCLSILLSFIIYFHLDSLSIEYKESFLFISFCFTFFFSYYFFSSLKHCENHELSNENENYKSLFDEIHPTLQPTKNSNKYYVQKNQINKRFIGSLVNIEDEADEKDEKDETIDGIINVQNNKDNFLRDLYSLDDPDFYNDLYIENPTVCNQYHNYLL